MNMSPTPYCDLCSHGIIQDLPHCMLQCDFNGIINDWVPAVLLDIDPSLIDSDLSSDNIVRLNIKTEQETHLQITVLWFLSKTLEIIWQTRKTRKQIPLLKFIAILEAEIELLMKTKYKKSANIIHSAINFDVHAKNFNIQALKINKYLNVLYTHS